MDLAALAIFRAVVRENGVTRAAEKLNRVQSNVTTRIKQLEEELGAALFVRDGRRLVLTPAGQTLLTYAERLLALADEARHAVREDRPRGRLRLGAMESTAASRLPALLARYHHAWPDVSLELLTGTTGCLIEQVREFAIDAALFARPPAPEALPDTFEVVPVFREDLMLLTPRGHPRVRTPRDVILPTLVAFERGCTYRKYVEQWYAAHGTKPARVLELGSYHAIVACVAAGAGVAVAPRSVLDLQPGTDNVAAHAIAEFEGIDTVLAWRKGYASAALGALRDALEAAARPPADAGKRRAAAPA
ncbi:LysR family transcriptional regulator [Burkholderia ubonensis]|uniref:LysR family transcriptional regulator n=1 Tax=Burkholderia ubonensis TaxID=101571 RepID=A0AAU8UC04_9BURK|nr:LysR family transcriptional regulator [Burkholderia ubonensis]AOK23105.1 LysR family transcriptional regulator [Burkholderia ubonensis]KVD07955.1 LysR family transcriptional regulator [Burkholderia ubonensis]KVM07706.1 LysR family transcriptional regulator [Burkholderia ubonensis]KVM11484.1 LysR family transcriptional regulator [Burkholderia ubonensis]KVM41806.1 LysR family transcriptional regulator [Burkholderia ubonensis]